MINCYGVSALSALCAQIGMEQAFAFDVSAPFLDLVVDDEQFEKFLGWIGIAETLANDFEMQAVHNRIEAIRQYLKRTNNKITKRRTIEEYRVLRETIDFGLRNQYIYRYPDRKRELFANWMGDWKKCLDIFPSLAEDIRASVDLWCLGHYNASAYQLMRVLEVGLSALAYHVGKRFDRQMWHNIIDEIESVVKLARMERKSPEKDQRLRFLSQACFEFRYFKDGWRNYVAHHRSDFDEYTSRSLLEHVRSFMELLASQGICLPDPAA